MYCTKCGKKVNDGDLFCSSCSYKFYNNINNVNYGEEKKEKASIGWWFLAFFIPVVGIVLFFIYRKTHPGMKKRLLSGTIVGFITGVISTILLIVILLTSFFKNVYKYYGNETGEGVEIHQTCLLKLFDDKDGIYNGYFILSSIYTTYYSSDYMFFDEEAKIKETATCIGNWAELRNGTIELITFELTLRYDFSGEGEEELKNYYKSGFEIIYGKAIADELISGKEVVISFDDSSYYQYVTLNKEKSTFSFASNF